MPRKKKPEAVSLPAIIPPPGGLVRPMTASGALVKVDAVYHLPDIHPKEPGPWSGEAEKVAWTDPLTGYGCIIRRSPERRHLCGYVSVPPGHPLFGRRYGTLTGLGLAVHGGLDYSAACEHWEREERSVCHVATRILPDGMEQVVHANAIARKHDDAWWFGFSCDKPGDVIPNGMDKSHCDLWRPGVDLPIYKDEAFVHDECVRLAVQLKAVEVDRDPREVDPGPAQVRVAERESGR